MVSGSSTRELLEALRQRANQRTGSPRATEDWNRIIGWEINGDRFFWTIRDGSIVESGPAEPQIVLRCTHETLARLTSGELPFFIAIWATGDIEYEGSFADAFRLGYIFLSDRRGRRVVFLAHCFLNANTRFPGGCAFEGATVPLIEALLETGVGIVQMPCAEFLCLGLEKPLYGELSEEELRECFRRLAAGVMDQVEAYLENGYEVAGIIGMNPSPSCGVEITKGKGTMLGLDRDTSEKAGPGVFIEELQGLARDRGLENLPFFGVRRMLPGEGGLEERLEDMRQRLSRKQAT
jgi:predicted secreted protein